MKQHLKSSPSRVSVRNGGIASRLCAGLVVGALFASVPAFAHPTSVTPGSWTPLTFQCPEGAETALVLTDGTVFVKSFDQYQHCFKLTPTGDGNYVNGTWTHLPDMPVGEIYGPCEVLKDGRLFLAGGEYLSPGESDNNTCEVYDPASNTWTQGPDGLYGDIGDTGNSIMSDGRVLVSTRFDMRTQIFDPTTMSWSSTGSMTNFTGDEESWQILPDNTILNVFNIGQRYLPTTGQWIPTAAMPGSNGLVDTAFEIGPAVMLYTGKIITFGGTNNTAIYTPPVALNGLGTWVVGPKIPGSLTSPDCPAAVEPDGKVIFISTPADFGVATFNEYDPVTNTMSVIAGPPGVGAITSFTPRFLTLPNGQILMTGVGSQCWLYNPAGTPQAAWRAHLTSVTRSGSTFTLTGTQLNGLTSGGSYGDDATMASNYPIVILRSIGTGKTYYAKSFNFSTMGLATGVTPVTCQFTLPSGLPAGSYNLTTSASGVVSSNSLQLGLFIGPNAVQVYAGQGQNPTGGVPQLLAIDQQYYTVQSVSNVAGEVAAVQISFQIPLGAAFSSIGCSLVMNAPFRTTNFIYLFNWKTNQLDLIGSAALSGIDQQVGADTPSSTNYVSPTGKVIAVDRVVYPVRLNGFQFTVKFDLASLTS